MANPDSQTREPASANILSLDQGRIRKLEKVLTDLRSGMRNLNELRRKPHDWDRRKEAQMCRIRLVENNLFTLKQRRLL
jgi:hypothetical protein